MSIERFLVRIGSDTWTVPDREHAEGFLRCKGGNGEIIRLVPESEIAAKDAEIERLRGEVADLIEGGPEWACSECGSTAGFSDVKYETMDGTDYDVECDECGSVEVEESPSAALQRMAERNGNAVAAAVAREREELLAALSQQRAIEEKHGTSGGYGLGLAQAIVRARPTPGAAKEV